MEKFGITKKKNVLVFAMFALFTVFQVAGIVLVSLGLKEVDLPWLAQSALYFVVCFFIYLSYRTHTKNVMKPLLGAILMLLLAVYLDEAFDNIQYFDLYLEAFKSDKAFIAFIVLEIAVFAVMLSINVMHYLINATHHSSPNKIKLNRLFCIFFVALVFAQSVCIVCVTNDTLVAIGNALACFADIFIVNLVVLVESSLDEFRLEREIKAE